MRHIYILAAVSLVAALVSGCIESKTHTLPSPCVANNLTGSLNDYSAEPCERRPVNIDLYY